MMDFNSVAFNLVAFYIKGCSGMVLPKILENITDVLNDGAIALNFTHNFIDRLASANFTKFTQLCGTDAFFVTQVLNVTDLVLHSFLAAAIGTKRLLSCSNFNPIYTSVAHDAICYHGVTGIRIIFSTQLCIAVFSMIMVTTRVSWQQIEEEF